MRYPIAPWARNVIILQWEAHFVKRLMGRPKRFLCLSLIPILQSAG